VVNSSASVLVGSGGSRVGGARGKTTKGLSDDVNREK